MKPASNERRKRGEGERYREKERQRKALHFVPLRQPSILRITGKIPPGLFNEKQTHAKRGELPNRVGATDDRPSERHPEKRLAALDSKVRALLTLFLEIEWAIVYGRKLRAKRGRCFHDDITAPTECLSFDDCALSTRETGGSEADGERSGRLSVSH